MRRGRKRGERRKLAALVKRLSTMKRAGQKVDDDHDVRQPGGATNQHGFDFSGAGADPQTGKKERDLEHARVTFIDQLEMLEAKTRGNLDKREEGLLKQSLTGLRLAFVEAVSKPAEPAEGGEPKAEQEKGGPAAAATVEGTGGTPGASDSHKKFTKKY